MHDMGIVFHDHLLGQVHATHLAYPAGIVTPEVDQHQVLRQFLRVIE